MTTTWPRYRNIESDDCGQCSYSQYQHSCGGQQQALGHGGYPSDTYPRQGPQCCQVEVTRGHQGHHQDQYPQHQQQQLPNKSSKSEKRERREREREHREREHRDREKEQRREQRERERQQQQQQQQHTQPAEQQHHQQQPSEPLVPDCVDCAAAAAATHQSLPVNGSGPPAATSSNNMQVDMGPYSQRAPEPGYQGQGGGKRERDGVESGYSTQNRDERDKERQGPGEQGAGDKKEKEKVNKTEQDQIQYIEGEGCQVWRPQVMMGCITFG